MGYLRQHLAVASLTEKEKKEDIYIYISTYIYISLYIDIYIDIYIYMQGGE